MQSEKIHSANPFSGPASEQIRGDLIAMDVEGEGPGSSGHPRLALPPKLGAKQHHQSLSVHNESPIKEVIPSKTGLRKRKGSHLGDDLAPEKRKFIGFGHSYVKEELSVRSFNPQDPLRVILLTKKRFPVLYFITFSVALFNIIAISSHKSFGQLYFNRDHFLASVGSIAALMFGFRGFVGFVVDKDIVGFQRLFVCITSSTASCALLLFWCAAADLAPMYLIVMMLVCACDGLMFVLTQKYIKK